MPADDANQWVDFTRANYRRLLQQASQAYRLMPVIDFDGTERAGVWRHDVDASPQAALALARIERDLDVRATYYFNLRSEFYNLFEPAVVRIVAAIAALGHEIGVHFDAANGDAADQASLERSLQQEQVIFRDLLGVQVRSFSFHNPSGATAGYTATQYAGLVNAYSAELLAAASYCSDSNGYWRFTPLERFLAEGHARIYVLTHPEWWPEMPMSPRERIARCVEGRATATLDGYDTLLAINNRKNIR